jgi:hypothetical protein
MESPTTGTGPLGGRLEGDGQGARAEEVKQRASEVSRKARGRAMERIDAQKGELCGLLDRLADTMEQDRMGAYASDYARRGAELLRGRSSDELVSSVRNELTGRPAAFLPLSFLAGFALARLARR